MAEFSVVSSPTLPVKKLISGTGPAAVGNQSEELREVFRSAIWRCQLIVTCNALPGRRLKAVRIKQINILSEVRLLLARLATAF